MVTGMFSAINKERKRRDYYREKSSKYYTENREKCLSDAAIRKDFILEKLRNSDVDFIEAAKLMMKEIKKNKKC